VRGNPRNFVPRNLLSSPYEKRSEKLSVACFRRLRAVFLRHELSSRPHRQLALVPAPAGEGIPPVRDGYMEVDFADGQKRRIRWPPNIDVVEGLLHCFDKPYGDAYADACRVRPD